MNYWLSTKEKRFNLSEKTLVMGILNVTPDSFSDGGRYNTISNAIEQAVAIKQAGADIIDIGGESTRPGHQKISSSEEIERVVPVIKAVKEAVDLPISIDTYEADVAKRALDAGASILNDIWGAKWDPDMAKVAAEYDVPIILMHNRDNQEYDNFMEDVKADLQESISIALRAGVKESNIILDPGVGFAKSYEENLEVMRKINQIKDLGYPLLLGTSRKRVIGTILDLPVEQRDEGTGATTCYGITQGVDIVRVHNVELTVRLSKMMDAIIGKGVIKYNG